MSRVFASINDGPLIQRLQNHQERLEEERAIIDTVDFLRRAVSANLGEGGSEDDFASELLSS